MIHAGVIEISPLAFMRGRTFKRAFIIADEMQNSTPNQMLMLTTRIGDKSKMVITGDLKQSDRSLQNGLLDIMKKIREQRLIEPELSIKMVEMNTGDIERSPIVAKILEMYSINGVLNSKNCVVESKELFKNTIVENLDLIQKPIINDAAMIPAEK